MLLKNNNTGDMAFIEWKWTCKGMFNNPFTIAKNLGVKIYAMTGSKLSKEAEFTYGKPARHIESWEEFGMHLSAQHPDYEMKALYKMFASCDARYCGYTDDPYGYDGDYADWIEEPIFIFYKDEEHLKFIWNLLDAREGALHVYICNHITRSIKTETVMAKSLEEAIKELNLEDYEPVNDPRLQPRKPRFTGGIAEIVRRELLG